MAEASVRLAAQDDLDDINRIYNYYVLNCTCTYQTQPETDFDRAAWFASHDEKHPVIVAEIDGEVVGWGALSHFHSRCAYRHTVEDSVYVRIDMHRRGVGRALLAELIDRACSGGHHTIIASISADQKPSIVLHEKMGFSKVAHLREVGSKFDMWLDVVYMQLMLNGASQDA